MEAGNPALGSHVVDAAGIGNLGSGTDYYLVSRVQYRIPIYIYIN
jgi:hypothetical protein